MDLRILAICLLWLISLGGCAASTALGDTFEGGADFAIIPLEGNQLTGETFDLDEASRFQVHPTAASNAHFETGDHMHISLRTGTIGWFSEGLLQRVFSEIDGQPVRGEIAVIANVTSGRRGPSSRGAGGGLEEGRVVFYSGDIYRQQRLNEFNVPIFGPAEYSGGPLTIDLWVLELDQAENQQMSGVLETLTSLARTIPSVQSAGLDILGQIGTSFLKSNRDDIIGHFTVTLVPPRPGLQATDPILSVSDIIVRRADARRSDLDFENCTYHPRSGVISGSPCQALRDNYLVLSIRKVNAGPDISSNVLLADLTGRLNSANSLTELQESLTSVADLAIGRNAYDRSLEKLDQLASNMPEGVRELDGREVIQEFQCALLFADAPSTKDHPVCRAPERHMNSERMRRLARALVLRTCLSAQDLSIATLLPGDRGEAALSGARDALVARYRLRTQGPNECAGQTQPIVTEPEPPRDQPPPEPTEPIDEGEDGPS